MKHETRVRTMKFKDGPTVHQVDCTCGKRSPYVATKKEANGWAVDHKREPVDG